MNEIERKNAEEAVLKFGKLFHLLLHGKNVRDLLFFP